MNKALQFVNNILKKRSVCFVLSDFIDENYNDALRIIARRHDLIGIHCWDLLERELPDVGVLRVTDAESNKQVWVDTTGSALRRQYRESFEAHVADTKNLFRQVGADFLTLGTHEPYVQALLKFFSQRSHKAIQHG